MIVHFHSMQQAENTPYSHYRRSMMSFMQYEVLCNEFPNSLLLSRFFLQLKLSFPNHLFFWIRRCQGLVTTNWPCSTAAPLLSPGDDLLRTRSTQHVETIIFASRISTRRAIVYLRGQMTDPDREDRERERERVRAVAQGPKLHGDRHRRMVVRGEVGVGEQGRLCDGASGGAGRRWTRR